MAMEMPASASLMCWSKTMINEISTTLLITGGTGSFGSAVLTAFSGDIGEIRIFSR